jgi:two-component system chemotaxis sensor kinase CheA
VDVTKYAELFLSESREHLSAINTALLDLERSDDPSEPVGALFRAVHTLKGMSATLGYHAVAELAHEMESLLERVRSGEHLVTPDTVDLLLAGADALEASVERAVAGESTEDETSGIVERLRALTGDGTDAPSALSAGAAAPAPGLVLPTGDGVLVRVRQSPDTDMPGVRAVIVLQRAKSLGALGTVSPPMAELQSATSPMEFAFRVATSASPEAIATHIRASGDVASVQVGDAPAERAPAGPAPATPAVPKRSLAPAAAGRAQRSVRVDVARLDGLMNLVGELVIARGRMAQLAGRLEAPALDEAVSQTARLIGDLQDEIVAARLVPVWQIFDRFPRMVRDSARATGKDVDFRVEGKDIELDRSLLEELGDPLVHLLRNAVDHGLEGPDERASAGKPPRGRLVLSALRDRSAVLIRVEDDGRGMDRERVRALATADGFAEATSGDLTDEELLRIIARPGFSTAERVTDLSGRGVGVDAVLTRVRQLGGTVELRTVLGEGTTWTLRLPLTLAIVRALLARVGTEHYAMPVTHVVETLDLTPSAMRSVRGQEVFVLRNDVLPLLRLRSLVELPPGESEAPQVVVIARGDRRAGVVVDELVGQQEIVVKQYDAVRDARPLFSGATILADGAPALIVDVGSLL